jgi:hypothetical protein
VSVEVTQGTGGRLFVITGDPEAGYEVRPVGEPVAWYERKFVARQDIRSGAIEASDEAVKP